MSLSFKILGPVEVRDGDRAVAVTSAKQRALLGAALLQANAVVPTARLVDAIWGDRPPNTANDLVQTYVSTLRRSIGSAGAGCIVTRAPGYLVRVDEGALDLHRFERLTAEADRAAADGDHDRATRLFGDALAHWRGPALAGLDSPVFRAAAARLEELRLRAVERRFEAASHLGATGWLVAELTAFVAEHPLREGTRALLMDVLYRQGRQAEALQVYQQGYAVLREELGVEPGPQLRRAHQAILFGDAEPAPAAASVGPHQLPPPVRLIGREPEERALGAALAAAARADRPALVTVDGPAGVGKTALALAVADRAREAFPDGRLFVPMRATGATPTPVVDALAMLLRSLDGADTPLPGSVDERAALLRTVLAGRRVLVLLDDAWNAAQVRPFLATHRGCVVLVTGRPTLPDLDADLRISLGPLTYRQSVELLGSVVGAQLTRAQAGAAGDIVSACEGLPLAVRAAAARLLSRPGAELHTLAVRLLDPRVCLDHLTVGDLDLRARLDGGFRHLDPTARWALRRLATEGTVFTAFDVAEALGTPVAVAERVADRIAAARLLDHHDGGYRLPRLVRLYARSLPAE
ncbi:hypothetical protein Val02_20550 [Virgisporangium aliadipatigenens]|uniref:OmpR/PhoB-type domain-containing protein n=1 Tax=Virgisporangium aliadipatigenens TaxID=741659 RepID=A0A8J3YH74_9ACTN|nr:BTAD domain-containing putative transcriptional regulator [Virgisporangium aliadipatigenens]GIJ45169.1 hypothetical protein Val02_20550 [Virgisporangium aliadipatigenens]